MKRSLLGVGVVVLLAVLAAPAIAEPAETSIDGPSTVEPGENVTYTFTVTNTGDNESSYLMNATLPDGWEIVDRADDGGNWQDSDDEWLYFPIEPGATKSPSLTVSVPEGASGGTVEITSVVTNTDGEQASAARAVTVEVDDGGGGGGSGGSGGGSDDTDDSTDNSGSSDSGGGSYSGGSSGSDDSSSGGSSSDSGSADTLDGDDESTTPDNGSVDDESNTTDSDVNTTDTESATPAGESAETTVSEPTSTAGGAASEPTAGPATTDTSDNGTAASDTGTGSNGAVRLALGALVILATGVGVVTARRDGVGESLAEAVRSGSLTDTETASTPDTDGYGGADVEVHTFHVAPDKCSITYATESMGNKEIGDEIREIARGYATADSEDIQTQRLEATVCHGDRTVATWHIRSEWLEQFKHGELSAEAFERRAVATLSFSS